MEVEDEAENPDDNEDVDAARDDLDRAVLSIIGAEDRLEDLKRATEQLLQIRSSEGGGGHAGSR